MNQFLQSLDLSDDVVVELELDKVVHTIQVSNGDDVYKVIRDQPSVMNFI